MALTWRVCRKVLNRKLVQLRSISVSQYFNEVFDIKNEEDFKTKVIESKKPVIVDFHAIWCGPCLELTPILTDIVEKRDGNVDLAKVNIDDNQELAIRYGVASIPTVLLIRNGKMSKSFVGLISRDEIEQFVPKE